MGVIRVRGGNRLEGKVRLLGAKNSALKLMACALLAQGRTVLEDVPNILDVDYMAELLRRLGCEVVWDPVAHRVEIDVPEDLEFRADYELVRKLRASICVLGPLVARTGQADIALPGGDNIGSRGLDMHLSGLARMGVTAGSEHGYVHASAPKGLSATSMWLDFPSVGATETMVMAAVLAEGVTLLDNVAREPEIVDICNMLNEMGAQITGVGTPSLRIEGVEKLHPVTHATVPDRIVAGTWAVAAAITGGDIEVTNGHYEHLDLPLNKLTDAGAEVETMDHNGDGSPQGAFRVRMTGRPTAVDVVTLPYPGFPTDLQPQFTALNAVADGVAMVTENLFESRFGFAYELQRLGADIRVDGHHAVIRGVSRLSGAQVESKDIRAGAGLLLAGLVAEGETMVYGVSHIDRGYDGIVPDLQRLGADIVREVVSDV